MITAVKTQVYLTDNSLSQDFSHPDDIVIWFNLDNTLISVCIFLIMFLYISYGADKENLFNNQELLLLVVISFILVPLIFDSGVILQGEIRCLLLLGVKG